MIVSRELIDQTYKLIDDAGMSIYDLSDRSGVSTVSLYRWRATRRVMLDNLLSLLGAMGYELVIRKIEK